MWNVATRQLVQLLSGHTDTVLSVDCNKANVQLASGGKDGSIKIWNLADKSGDMETDAA
jgi:WD40 repeat protein